MRLWDMDLDAGAARPAGRHRAGSELAADPAGPDVLADNARSAVGVAELPLGSPVELEIIVEVS